MYAIDHVDLMEKIRIEKLGIEVIVANMLITKLKTKIQLSELVFMK